MSELIFALVVTFGTVISLAAILNYIVTAKLISEETIIKYITAVLIALAISIFLI